MAAERANSNLVTIGTLCVRYSIGRIVSVLRSVLLSFAKQRCTILSIFPSHALRILAGCVGTAGILTAGLYAFKKGNRELSQKLMRYRVLAQFATVSVMGVPFIYHKLAN
mmetsp:Transcript_48675/g.126322  ORF Transcript_48675/g.126322 Transcript_48675/m.126322 type:complete len:110 (-) Transcript_48675:316-645(-)